MTKIPKLKLIRAYELKTNTDMNWYEVARAIGGISGDNLKATIERVEKDGLKNEYVRQRLRRTRQHDL